MKSIEFISVHANIPQLAVIQGYNLAEQVGVRLRHTIIANGPNMQMKVILERLKAEGMISSFAMFPGNTHGGTLDHYFETYEEREFPKDLPDYLCIIDSDCFLTDIYSAKTLIEEVDDHQYSGGKHAFSPSLHISLFCMKTEIFLKLISKIGFQRRDDYDTGEAMIMIAAGHDVTKHRITKADYMHVSRLTIAMFNKSFWNTNTDWQRNEVKRFSEIVFPQFLQFCWRKHYNDVVENYDLTPLSPESFPFWTQ